MSRVILILLSILIFLKAEGQDYNYYSEDSKRHQYSSAPETAKYEIVQSEWGVRETYMIDKHTGKVYQLVKGLDDELTWQLIPKLPHPQDTIIPNSVNYQFWTSRSGVRFTFLLNINTGATWQITEDPDFGLFWSPID